MAAVVWAVTAPVVRRLAVGNWKALAQLRRPVWRVGWGLSACLGWTRWRPHMQQKWREGAADTSRAQSCGRHRWFPGQVLISDQTTRQPQLPQTSRQQPGPHLTCARVSGSNRGPAKLVLTKTKALLD